MGNRLKQLFAIAIMFAVLVFNCGFVHAAETITWEGFINEMKTLTEEGFTVGVGENRIDFGYEGLSTGFTYNNGVISLATANNARDVEQDLFTNLMISYVIAVLSDFCEVDFIEVADNYSQYGITLSTEEYVEGGTTVAKTKTFSVNMGDFYNKTRGLPVGTGASANTGNLMADVDQLVSVPVTHETMEKYNITEDEVVEVDDNTTSKEMTPLQITSIVFLVLFVLIILAMLGISLYISFNRNEFDIERNNVFRRVFIVLAVTGVLFGVVSLTTALVNDANAKSSFGTKWLSTRGLVSLTENNATTTVSRVGNVFLGTQKLFGFSSSSSLFSKVSTASNRLTSVVSKVTDTSKSMISGLATIVNNTRKAGSASQTTTSSAGTINYSSLIQNTPSNQSIISAASRYLGLLTDSRDLSKLSDSTINSFISSVFQLGTTDALTETLSRINVDGGLMSLIGGNKSDVSLSTFMTQLGSAFNRDEDPVLYKYLFGNHDSKKYSSDVITIATQFLADTRIYDVSVIKGAVEAGVQAFKEADFDTMNISEVISYVKGLTSEFTNAYGAAADWDSSSSLAKTATLSSVSDMVGFVNMPQFNAEYTSSNPIGIGVVNVSGDDYANSKNDTAVLVSLCSTGIAEGQAYGIISDILSATEQMNSSYLKNIESAITTFYANNPNAPRQIIVAGMSLGGMIQQQLLADVDFLANNNLTVKNAVMVAAPLLSYSARSDEKFWKNIYGNSREEKISHLRRLIDINDIVPFFSRDFFEREMDKIQLLAGKSMLPTSELIASSETLRVYTEGNDGLKYTDAKYKKEYPLAFLGTHALGYMALEEWEHYDALGYYSSSLCFERSGNCKQSQGYYDGLSAWNVNGGNLDLTDDYTSANSYHEITFKYGDITWYPSPSMFSSTLLSTLD